MFSEKSRTRALKQRIEDLPNGAKRSRMQRAYACLDSMTRTLQNMHDGAGSIEDMNSLTANVRQDAEMVAGLMFNIYCELGGLPHMWMSSGTPEKLELQGSPGIPK